MESAILMLTYFPGAATAVENQLSEMNAIKERSHAEKQRWMSTMLAAYKEITVRLACWSFLAVHKEYCIFFLSM
jgi:hypothetical protein